MAEVKYAGEGTELRMAALREEIELVTGLIGERQASLAALTDRRSERLRSYATTHVADLRDETLARLEERFPGFRVRDRVRQEIGQAQAPFLRQLQGLGSFDPAEAESRILRLEVRLPPLRSERDQAQEAFDALAQIPDVTRLIASGYDTGTYPHRFWQRQYHADWRAADKACTQAKVPDWRALLVQYLAHQRARDMAVLAVQVAETERDGLQANLLRHRELSAALADAASVQVLPLVRAQFQAFLEAADPSPCSEVATFDQRINRLHEEVFALEERRLKALTVLAEFDRAKAKALRYAARLAAEEGEGGASASPRVSPPPEWGPTRG